MEHHDVKQLGEGVYLAYSFTVLFIIDKKSGQELILSTKNLEAGSDTEAVDGCCLLACSLCLAQSAFLKKAMGSNGVFRK